jgi:HSP20 family protein
MMDEMDRRLASAMFGNGEWASLRSLEARAPTVDVREETDRYLLEAEIPGMNKDEVQVDASDGILEIAARHDEGQEAEKEGYIRKERSSRQFFRRLSLPEDVDEERITARLENGVLQVTLMKKALPTEKKTRVEVQ